MFAKSSVVLLGLVVAFVSVTSAPVEAQGGQSISYHRVCTIAPGQGQDAVAFAREISDYIDGKWPEVQIGSVRPLLLPNNQIHWVSQHENMADFSAKRPAIFGDSGYQDILAKAVELFEPNTCVDTLFANLR